MSIERFHDLLKDLAKLAKITIPDQALSTIKIAKPNEPDLFIQMDALGELVYILVEIAPLPEGHLKTAIMEAALKANGTSAQQAIFSYSDKKNMLLLFKEFYMTEITGEQLFEEMTSLRQYSTTWKDAIDKGETPQQQSAPSPFGMH